MLVLFAAASLSACEWFGDDAKQGIASGSGEDTNTFNQEGELTKGETGNITPGSPQEFTEVVGDRVFFEVDRSTLTQEGQDTLRKQAEWLKQYSNYRVTVEGHCDERGTREYNLALGERRANAAKNYLVSLGVDAGRITTISYGKEHPEYLGSNEAAWSKNRRAVSVVN